MSKLLIFLTLLSGLLAVFLILSSGADDQGLLSNSSSGRFIPGSLDAAKNKIISLFVIIFFIGNIALIMQKTIANQANNKINSQAESVQEGKKADKADDEKANADENIPA